MQATVTLKFELFLTRQLLICNLHPCSLLVLPASSVSTLTWNWPLNSYSVVIVPKLTYVWVFTSSTKLSLLTKLLFCRILTESFRQNILHTLLKKELGRFNGRLKSKLEAFVCLPGEKRVPLHSDWSFQVCFWCSLSSFSDTRGIPSRTEIYEKI